MPPALSYILTTRNKLTMLREVLSRLVTHRRPDEEIVVVDAASSDGTAEYLAELHRAGAIQSWLSESDRSEGHGYNKALLRSQGDLIKVITDDDAFYWPGIDLCRSFMEEHRTIDVLSGNTDTTYAEDPAYVYRSPEPERGFKEWLRTSRPFHFCGLGLMIRRSSLPLLGLFSTSHIVIDVEYALRVSRVANIAWYTGLLARRICNDSSNYHRDNAKALAEVTSLSLVHPDASNLAQPTTPTWRRLSPRRVAGRLLRMALRRPVLSGPGPESGRSDAKCGTFASTYLLSELALDTANRLESPTIRCRSD